MNEVQLQLDTNSISNRKGFLYFVTGVVVAPPRACYCVCHVLFNFD